MEQILQIGIVKFGEANFKVLSSNFVLFFTLALVFYLALFVKENEAEAASVEEAPTPAPARARATSSAGERLTTTPRKSANNTPSKETPRKETPRKERGETPKRGRRPKAAQSDKEASEEEEEPVKTPRKPRSTTPRKSTAKKVDLGHIVSPDGSRASIRLRNKTPAKL